MKHTTGEWRVNPFGTQSVVTCWPSTGTNIIISIVGNETDARLISAAPDLLEACLEVWEHDTDMPISKKTFDKVNAAIAKAKGCGR